MFRVRRSGSGSGSGLRFRVRVKERLPYLIAKGLGGTNDLRQISFHNLSIADDREYQWRMIESRCGETRRTDEKEK